MKKVLVVQFRLNKDAARAERADIARAAEGRAEIVVVNALTDDVEWSAPASLLSGYHGVILGGSGDLHFDGGAQRGTPAHDMMYDVARTMQPFIAYLLAHDIPTLGICLGHQLLAYAAGVAVRQCPQQAKTGTFTVVKKCSADDPIFGTLPQTFAAQYGHKDSVTALPHGATLLAAGEQCNFGALRYGKHVYSTQFHPELDVQTMKERIAAHPEYVPEGANPDTLFAPSPHATQVLINFFTFVAQRAE